MNVFYTYELCSSETPHLPFYIGKGKKISRMYSHEKSALKRNHINKHLQNKILKIKRNNYQIVYRKIAENISEQDAFTIEKDMIDFNKSLGFNLCNYTEGGEGVSGFKHPHTEETKIKIGKGNTGKKCSEEKKRKISISNMGRIVSEETKQKLKLAAKYRPKISDETRQKMKLRIPWNKRFDNY